jgi:hypothetical protein
VDGPRRGLLLGEVGRLSPRRQERARQGRRRAAARERHHPTMQEAIARRAPFEAATGIEVGGLGFREVTPAPTSGTRSSGATPASRSTPASPRVP